MTKKTSTKKAVNKKAPAPPKIKEVTIGATVPTMQYGNLQPSITLTGGDLEGLTNQGISWITEIHNKFGERPLESKTISVASKVKETSFNEGFEIEYDEVNHKYYFKGKQLSGVTDYISQYSAKFDTQSIAKKCASAWNMEAIDIENMWKTNGDITSMFGTAIHKAIEHYLNYRVIRNEGATPKHPVLKSIVDGFASIYNDEKQYSEVLISDVSLGYCGRADSIAERNGVYVVQDWKINIESDVENRKYKLKTPFEELPAKKLSKYQIQMSVYANMLAKSGKKVSDLLEVYVFEEEWKKYELPVMNVLYAKI
jgi:hypothetical protein